MTITKEITAGDQIRVTPGDEDYPVSRSAKVLSVLRTAEGRESYFVRYRRGGTAIVEIDEIG